MMKRLIQIYTNRYINTDKNSYIYLILLILHNKVHFHIVNRPLCKMAIFRNLLNKVLFYLAYFFSVGNERLCNPKELTECVFPAEREFVRMAYHSHCNCRQSCKEITYTTSVSAAPASEFTLDYVARTSNRSKEFFRKNLALLSIYFEDISVSTITQQEAYNGFALMSDIGGALSLVLGATVLSILEFLHFGLIAFGYIL